MVSVDQIRQLRQNTGAGIMDCKRALEDAGGNWDEALQLLREKGFADAAKKADRTTGEGLIEAYIHTGGRLGALLEIDCETDFVARTAEMRVLAHDLAMQVAAMPSTAYLDRSEMDDDDERPPEEVCLLEQSFIKDPSRTVSDMVQEARAKLGENIRVRRFARFALGE